MIIVKATMYPAGGGRSYEVLHASIENVGQDHDGDKYFAHVTQRPWTVGPGYEADVEVRGHRYDAGLTPLLAAILGQAGVEVGYGIKGRLVLPECTTRQRVQLFNVAEFEQAARRYT